MQGEWEEERTGRGEWGKKWEVERREGQEEGVGRRRGAQIEEKSTEGEGGRRGAQREEEGGKGQ
jgi:hypothetical protein